VEGWIPHFSGYGRSDEEAVGGATPGLEGNRARLLRHRRGAAFPAYVGETVTGICKRLGLKIRPYDLRHAFALHYLRNGGHALAMQRTLAHTDPTTTKRYVALTQHDLRKQHTLASPLNAPMPQRARRRKVDR
jgi:integrase